MQNRAEWRGFLLSFSSKSFRLVVANERRLQWKKGCGGDAAAAHRFLPIRNEARQTYL
jgi:hypothetical protein